MMFRFPSVICTRCTGFFCLAIIKGPPNDIYCIIEEPYKHYFTEKVSYSRKTLSGLLTRAIYGGQLARRKSLNYALIFPENILLTLFFMSMNTIFTYFRICENSYK